MFFSEVTQAVMTKPSYETLSPDNWVEIFNRFLKQFSTLKTMGYLDVSWNLRQIVKEQFGSIQLPFYYTMWFTENYHRLPRSRVLGMIARLILFLFAFFESSFSLSSRRCLWDMTFKEMWEQTKNKKSRPQTK